MASQDEIFRRFEADKYFERNRDQLSDYDPQFDPIVVALNRVERTPTRILDYGAADGRRLSWLCDRFGAEGVGIDPSQAAVNAARIRDPDRHWLVGTIADHPTLDLASYDLVVCSFVLHWIDRRTLLSSLADIDAHVANRGIVMIHDFLPDRPHRNHYHHLPTGRVFTYKQDYGAILLQTGLYRQLYLQRLSLDRQPRPLEADDTGDARGISVLERLPDPVAS